jgi:hypothetical protein
MADEFADPGPGHSAQVEQADSAMKLSPQETAIRLSEHRNSFVHYKWRGRDLDAEEETELKELLGAVEKVVRYLGQYERSVIFGGKSKLISDFARKRPSR